MKVPRISVLVPTYNACEYIQDMVESVVCQTLTDWELVIVDDGSTDSTQKVLDAILHEYNDRNIGVVSCTHSGCAAALKTAIDVSGAPLCTFVGADDILTPNSLADIVETFDTHPKVGFLWTCFVLMDQSLRKVISPGWSKGLPKDRTLKEALLQNFDARLCRHTGKNWWGASCQEAFRRELYLRTSGLDASLPYAVDLQLACLFAESGCDVRYVPVVTYCYRKYLEQMSSSQSGLQRSCSKLVLQRLAYGKYVREL